MNISRYIIIFFLILSCCVINHELRVMQIAEGCIDEYSVIFPENDLMIDERTAHNIKKIIEDNNVKPILVEINDSNLVSREIIYKCSDEIIDDVCRQMGIFRSRVYSFIFPDLKIQTKSLECEDFLCDYYVINLCGSADDINNVLEQIKENTGLDYKVSSKTDQDFNIMIIPWLVTLCVVVFFNIFVFSVTKKETTLNIVFGYSPVEKFLRCSLIDTVIYFAEFLISIFIVSFFTGLSLDINLMIIMYLLMSTVDILLNLRYFGVYKKISGKISDNIINAESLVSQSYIIRFIVTTMMIIFISYSFTSVIPLIKYIKAKNVIVKYNDYSFSRMIYHHDETEDIMELLQNENLVTEDIYRKYFDQCDILTLVCYDGIVYANVNAYSYIYSKFEELKDNDLQKDLYFLIPDNLSETQKAEILKKISSVVTRIEGKEFNYTYEVIEYKSGKDIMVFNYSDNGCGFEFVQNPYLVYNTINPSTLDTNYLSTDRISIAYSSIYHMSEDVVDKIKNIYPQIDIEQTNIMELYYRYFSQAKLMMLIQLTASVCLFILLISVISILVKAAYGANAKEYALKKVFGYSFPNRYRQLLVSSVISDLMSVCVSRLMVNIFFINRFDSSLNASHFPYEILWTVSAFLLIVNIIILILKIYNFEKKNIIRILKDGAI